jgi:hypothetical protein
MKGIHASGSTKKKQVRIQINKVRITIKNILKCTQIFKLSLHCQYDANHTSAIHTVSLVVQTLTDTVLCVHDDVDMSMEEF